MILKENIMQKRPKVLVIATSRKTRGGITSVIKAHETGPQWKKYHCKWIQTHRDSNIVVKCLYFITAFFEYICLLPFYNIVHIHAGLRTSIKRKLIFASIAKIYKKKIIIHFHPATEKHLFDDRFKHEIYKLFSYSNLLIVLSPQWIKWINEAFPNNNFNMKVLYNPCPTVKRSTATHQNIILYAGTLNERKGYNRLLEAFSKIADHYKTWSIAFAGNGEIEIAKKIQNELNISVNQVKYLGWISGKEKEKVFQEAAIYCLPSWGEGFPMGILDAMAYGIPVITTPVGGITDIITNGTQGIIYDTYDIDALATALSTMIDSEDLRGQITSAADKLVYGIFNIKNICAELDKIYEEVFTTTR